MQASAKKFEEVSIHEAAYQGDFETVKKKLDDDPSLILQPDNVSSTIKFQIKDI